MRRHLSDQEVRVLLPNFMPTGWLSITENFVLFLTDKKLDPFTSNFVKMLEELNIIHCVDLLKVKEPACLNDVLYTRLFGKGHHNIYQPLDSELKQIDLVASKEAKKKVEEHFNPKMKKSQLDQFF